MTYVSHSMTLKKDDRPQPFSLRIPMEKGWVFPLPYFLDLRMAS